MAEILAAIEAERLATDGVAWKELLLPANRYRVFIIITLQIGMSSLITRAPSVLTQSRCATYR
jgi:hypothetical protein